MAQNEITPARLAAAELRDEHLRDVVRAVAQSFRLREEWITGDWRTPPVVRARWAAFYIAREIWGYPVRDICEFFRKDHTSVYEALVRTDRIYKSNPEFRKRTDEAVREIWPTLPVEKRKCTAA